MCSKHQLTGGWIKALIKESTQVPSMGYQDLVMVDCDTMQHVPASSPFRKGRSGPIRSSTVLDRKKRQGEGMQAP